LSIPHHSFTFSIGATAFSNRQLLARAGLQCRMEIVLGRQQRKHLSIIKIIAMKQNSINHEILLFLGTTFSKLQLCGINAQENMRSLVPAQQLEIACWNGLLDELLPEIMQIPFCIERLYVWYIETEKTYLKIDKGVSHPVPEDDYSVDPHVFFYMLQMN